MAGVFAPRPDAIDPRAHFGWARGVIAAAVPFAAEVRSGRATADPPGIGRIAHFAAPPGGRYTQLRHRLRTVARELEPFGIGRWEVVADGAHVIDRDLAVSCGLGWFGKSANVLSRVCGSWMVLGAVLTESLPGEGMRRPAQESRCGGCVACVQACPTGALREAYRCDASLCLSQITQSPLDISTKYRPLLGTTVYGCDRCQTVCPINLRAESAASEFAESHGEAGVDLLEMALTRADALGERYSHLYFPRRDFNLLRRNALVGMVNSYTGRQVPEHVVQALKALADDESDVVREYAVWAGRELESAAREIESKG